MELDWSTFLLEIVNFLILVWVLKRFLYKPVIESIAERRRRVEGILNDAEKMRNDALSLKAVEEARLAEWEEKRQSMEESLAEEIGLKRERMLKALDVDIEKQKSRNAAIEERRMQEWQKTIETRALGLGAVFAAKLLSRLAGPELDAMIYDLFMEDLEKIDASSLQASLQDGDVELDVSSAFPLSQDKRKKLLGAMEEMTGRTLKASFATDASLVGGLRVGIGAWVLRACLADELAFFRKTGNGA